MNGQFSIGPYRTDFYFPEHKTVVQCDEYDDRNRDIDYEINRPNFIEDQLKCMFIRYNPDAGNVMIARVFSKIFRYIYLKGSFQPAHIIFQPIKDGIINESQEHNFL